MDKSVNKCVYPVNQFNLFENQSLNINKAAPKPAFKRVIIPHSNPQTDYDFIAFLSAVCDEWESQELSTELDREAWQHMRDL